MVVDNYKAIVISFDKVGFISSFFKILMKAMIIFCRNKIPVNIILGGSQIPYKPG